MNTATAVLVLLGCALIWLGAKALRSYRRKHPMRRVPAHLPEDLLARFPYQSGIPRIIHQTAPKDRDLWHPRWHSCQASWIDRFPDHAYRFWDDDDLERLIREDFPWFLPTYQAYPKHIMRVDACRYFILFKHGGIYADMDYEALRPFAEQLPADCVSVCESPYKENECCQNSLLASPVGHPFWVAVFKALFIHRESRSVLIATGPRLLDYAIEQAEGNVVHCLPQTAFNPHKESAVFHDLEPLYARHWGTVVWWV